MNKPKITNCPMCKMPIFSWVDKTHICWKSPSEIAREKVLTMDISQKQKILDLVWGGLTLGEVSRQSNVTLDEVCEIVTMNIQTVKFLSLEAK